MGASFTKKLNTSKHYPPVHIVFFNYSGVCLVVRSTKHGTFSQDAPAKSISSVKKKTCRYQQASTTHIPLTRPLILSRSSPTHPVRHSLRTSQASASPRPADVAKPLLRPNRGRAPVKIAPPAFLPSVCKGMFKSCSYCLLESSGFIWFRVDMFRSGSLCTPATGFGYVPPLLRSFCYGRVSLASPGFAK